MHYQPNRMLMGPLVRETKIVVVLFLLMFQINVLASWSREVEHHNVVSSTTVWDTALSCERRRRFPPMRVRWVKLQVFSIVLSIILNLSLIMFFLSIEACCEDLISKLDCRQCVSRNSMHDTCRCSSVMCGEPCYELLAHCGATFLAG